MSSLSVRSGTDQASSTVQQNLECLRQHLRECWSDSCNQVSICLNASFQSFSRVLFNLVYLPHQNSAYLLRRKEEQERVSCRCGGVQSVRQINTQADRIAHPSSCRSPASHRQSRFPFLQVTAERLQITSATLRCPWGRGHQAEMTQGGDRRTPCRHLATQLSFTPAGLMTLYLILVCEAACSVATSRSALHRSFTHIVSC